MNCKRIFAALRSSAVGVFCLALLLLARPASAQTVTYYHTDPLGSVVAETDAAGNVTKRYDYEPYGALVGGQVEDGPGYTGHVSDASTGLSYMQQRYMDPQLGVFLSVDPVTAYQKPVDQFNRYRYANGNPYSFTDRDGRSATLVAPWVIVPIVVATTYYVVTTPEQRKKAGERVDRGIRRLFQSSESSDASSDAGTTQPGDADSAEGCIYCVDGSKTESGRDYVGSTDDMRRRERDASDGRDRSGAERIGSYAKGDREGRRNQEQQAINDRGGKGVLDNKRNEVSPAKWEERNIKPPEG